MRDYRRTGRKGSRLSDYHMALHVAAQERAVAMLALLKQGLSDHEIGQRFGCTAHAVYQNLRRRGLG